ncbi:MAG: IS607 family transposase, partial [Candidatus Altiarchaeales archaeon]|nr:IS607 family transposase [Candidatus Altiarchaeales archaeon]
LDSQAKRVSDYCAAKGYQVTKQVKEIGSGLNDQRKKFQSLLKEESIDIIVVEHKDRATRFGVHYIQTLLETQGKKLEIINEVEEDQEDLMEDLVSIITSFMARYYGRRRAKRKTEKIIDELRSV